MQYRSLVRVVMIAASMMGIMDRAVAEEFRWAASGDVQSLDPHFTIETFSTSMLANVYEPLVRRSSDMKLALAVSWTQTDRLSWSFKLREGVTFQDGSPFTADDVIFSFERAGSGASAIKGYFAAVQSVSAPDATTVIFKMKRVDPILPDEISNWLIMSRKWADQHGATKPAGASTASESLRT